MSLLNFLATQRQHWQQQPAKQAPEFLVGGLVALDQAEAAFKATPLYNALYAAHQLSQELEEVSYQLSRVRHELLDVRKQLALANETLALRPKWGQRARRALEKLAQVLEQPATPPELKLTNLHNMLASYRDNAERDMAPKTGPQTPAPPVPLPE